jgi:hypothetical protein
MAPVKAFVFRAASSECVVNFVETSYSNFFEVPCEHKKSLIPPKNLKKIHFLTE